MNLSEIQSLSSSAKLDIMEPANAGQRNGPAVDAMRSTSTASTGLLCLRSFDRLLNALQTSAISRGTESRLSVVAVQDELGRFKIWAGNIGAFQPATRSSSLEHRLRDASNVRDHIIRLLRDLNFTLNECKFGIFYVRRWRDLPLYYRCSNHLWRSAAATELLG